MQKPSPEPQIGSRTISRVLYHLALAGGMATVIPLGAQLPVPSSNLPGSVDRADPLPYLVLLRTGLAELVTSPCRLVGSYPTVSPLPPEGGGLLSVALSEDHSPWALPSVLPCEARTFLSVRHAETRRTRRQSIRLPKTQKLFGVVRHFISRLVGLFIEVLHPVNQALTVGAVDDLMASLQFNECLRGDHDPATGTDPGSHGYDHGMGQTATDELIAIKDGTRHSGTSFGTHLSQLIQTLAGLSLIHI